MTGDADASPRGGAGVPPYREQIFKPRSHRYCVCVFVVNEGDRLLRQLTRMRPATTDIDVLIADGGSTDGSVAPDRLEPNGVRALLAKLDGPGLGGQMRMAFDFAIREGYEGVITIDGNNKDDPSAIPRFVESLDRGFDHVQGSRFVSGGFHRNTPLVRRIAVKVIHAPLIRWASGFRYTDTTNGFRAYSRRLLLDPNIAVFRDVFRGYELHYYLAIRAARLGFHVSEIGVGREYPERGRIPTKISPLKGNVRVLAALLAACTGRFDPPDSHIPAARLSR